MADNDKENKEAAAEAQEDIQKPKKSLLKKIPLMAILVGVNVLGTGASLFVFWSATLGAPDPKITEAQAYEDIYQTDIFGDKPIVYSLDPFTVNLADEEQRIVQIAVSLEMIDEDGFEEIVTMGSHARDTIVHLLNSKTYRDISSIQGKLYLKDEITLALNQQLKESFIKDVYFSKFMIQDVDGDI